MYRAELGDDADRAGECRKRACVAVENGPADIVQTQTQRIEPGEKKAALHPETVGQKLCNESVQH